MDDLTGDIRRTIQQKDQSLPHFLQVRPPAGGDLLQVHIGGRPVARRQDGSQRQPVDRDAGRQGDGKGAGEGSQGGIADRVGQVIGPGVQGAPVQQVDDAAGSSWVQGSGRRPG